MTESPKMTVVVAAYNVDQYLHRCVRSLLEQTERSLEVLIIDDGSTDGTAGLVDQLASLDPRVRPIHRQNGGLSVARNTGLQAAKGKFICFIDGDDWVDPGMVESMVSWCESTQSPVAIAGIHVDFHDKEDCLLRSERRVLPHYVIRRETPLSAPVYDERFVNLLGYAWNKIYCVDWLRRLGVEFEDGLTLVEDIDFNAKVLGSAERVVLVPDEFVHYVQRPRLTLGTTFDATLLAKRLRAVNSVNSLLEAWGVDPARRTERAAYASGVALWTALRFAASSRRPEDQLREMVGDPAGEKLMRNVRAKPAANLRGLWATLTLKCHWYGVALLPLHAYRAVQGLARLRIRLSRGQPRTSS